MELIKPNININFLGNRYYAYAFTTIMIVLSLASIPIMGYMKLGIDFTGGAVVQVKFNKPVHTDQVREALKPLGENLAVQQFSGARVTNLSFGWSNMRRAPRRLSQQVKDLLETQIGKGSTEIRSLEVVGPKVGKDLQESAIWATVIALIFLLIYMAFRFTFTMGLGAIVCLIHDLCIVYGFFAWTGKEFNLTILAAMLTVIGYDINDTIVVCDRIRENLKSMKKVPLIDVFNAIHQSDAFKDLAHQRLHPPFRGSFPRLRDECAQRFRLGAHGRNYLWNLFLNLRRLSPGLGAGQGTTSEAWVTYSRLRPLT